MEGKKEKLPSTNINWLITIYLNPFGTPYKIKKNSE